MKRILSVFLCVVLFISCIPSVTAGADSVIEIFDNNSVIITEKQYLQEYRTAQLYALEPSTAEDGSIAGVAIDTSSGSYIEWASNLPLLANVDDSGKVTAYDFSKKAVIQLWIDENIKVIPLVGESTAEAIWNAIDSSGIDLDNTDTDTIVRIVSTIAGDSLGESLRTYLDNMNVVITATLYGSDGEKLGSDSVEFVIEKSIVASVAPTGVHITNKKVVPKTVAVGATVQLYGVCTPVRLNQGIKWYVGSNMFESESQKYATVSETGLVTFTAPGTATIRVNPENALYGTFSDTVTFTIVDREDLPVESFSISGDSSVAEGEAIQLSVENVQPAGAYQGDLAWSSADPSIAVVDEQGVVVGLDGGSGLTYSNTVTITATMGGVSVNKDIKVTRPMIASVSSVEISGNSSLGIGESTTYDATVFPSRLNTSSSVTREWGIVDAFSGEYIPASSGNPAVNEVAGVDENGLVTAVGAGVVTIYCKATYNSSSAVGTYQIVCGKAITDFSINGTISVKECATSQLYIVVNSPADYETKLLDTVVWSIDNDAVASISETGLLLGRDAGGRSGSSSQSAVVTATVSGVSRSVTVTVTGQGLIAINKYSDAQVDGTDCVIVDLPRSYSIKTYPSRIDQTATYWGVQTDEGAAPWSASQTYGGDNRNTQNSFSSISDDGILSGKKAGKTVVYAYAKNLLSTYIEAKKEIDVIELVPVSITLKEPDKTEYLEGVTELDLTGMEVYLNYSRDEVSQYYPDAESYTDSQLTARVTDYTISTFNPNALDMQQYIIVSVTRAGKVMNAVFPVTISSKKVDSLTVSSEKTFFMEDEEIDFSSVTVIANYLNAESEEIFDYTIDYQSFDPHLYDVEQNVRITYSHAGRSVEAFIPITIYGYPVVTVESNGKLNGWNSGPVTFTLSCTHPINGVSYMYRGEGSSNWVNIAQNQCYFSKNRSDSIYFKAINSAGIESKETGPYAVKIDTISPEFIVIKSNESITNQSYDISINVTTIGESDVESITVDGEEIDLVQKTFTVSRNGEYIVRLTAGNGLYCEQSVIVDNIDKEAPGVVSVELFQGDNTAPKRELEGNFGLYYSADVYADVVAQDSGVAGISHIKYRLVDENYRPISQWVNIQQTENGVCNTQFKGYFEFVAVDNAGNESSPTYSNGFTRDSVKPVVTEISAFCGEKEYNSSVWADDIVTLTPYTDAFSGVYEVVYRVNNGEWHKVENTTVDISGNGTSVCEFKAVSYSGLESDVFEFVVNIDRVVPLIRVDFEGTFGRWTNEAVTFTLDTLNECPSGCTYYFDCGSGWQKLESNIAKITESTNAYYRFKAINGAGLESAPSDTYLVMIDNVTPQAQIIYGQTGKTDAPYDIVVRPLTGEAGTNKVYFDGEDITDTLTFTVNENGKYMLTIIGNNMLSSTIPVMVENFSIIPSVVFSYEKIDDENIRIIGYSGGAKNVTVPFEIDGYTVKEISDGVFANDDTLVSVNIAPTVESIGEGCFENCPNLQKVIICEKVSSIGGDAFNSSDNIVIYCYKNSIAEAYAQEHNIPYELLDIIVKEKTIINDEAGIIFTQQTEKQDFSEIISAEGYNVMAVPSFMPADDLQFFGTGSIVYLFKGGRLEKTYTLVLFGDLNGDSAIDVLDAFLAQRAQTEKVILEEAFNMAADVDNSGMVDVNDYQQIINLVLR